MGNIFYSNNFIAGDARIVDGHVFVDETKTYRLGSQSTMSREGGVYIYGPFLGASLYRSGYGHPLTLSSDLENIAQFRGSISGAKGAGLYLGSDLYPLASGHQGVAAFVRVTDTGSSLIVRDSYGVNSVIDQGVGLYYVTMSNPASQWAATMAATESFSRFASVIQANSTVAHVRIKDASGTDADGSFSFAQLRSTSE